MSSLDHVWPSNYPQSLWNYEALQAPRNIPFMGYQFSTEFFFAFAAGAAVIVIFALRRFNEHSSEPNSFEFKVLRTLKPMDLRAGSLMTQAYIRYVGVLLLIYLALTLFGNLIFKAVNALPSVAGLQVDTGSFDFNSPQWPLLISFGMVGFVPMLKPVEVIEGNLRAWAHRSAGIPTKITDHTNRTKKALDDLTGPAPGIENAPDWLEKIAPGESERHRAFRTRLQAQYLLDWSKDQRPYWPSPQARNKLRELEQTESSAAFAALEAFDDLMMEEYDRITNSADGDGGLRESPTQYAAKSASSEGTGGITTTGSQDPLVRHRRRLEREWNDITAQLENLRDEMASILAIFAEHDDRYHEIQNSDLRTVVEKAVGEEHIHDGPNFWIYLSLVPVAGVYLWAVLSNHQSLLSNVDKDVFSIFLSVMLYTTKTAIQFGFPLSVVMAWRFTKLERPGAWVPINIWSLDRVMVRQLLVAAGLAFVVSAVLLALLGMLWAALISRNELQFESLYLYSRYNYLLFYSTQAMIAVVNAVMALLAVEYVRIHNPKTKFPLIPMGILNAFLVLCAWAAHTAVWFQGFNLCASRTVVENGPVVGPGLKSMVQSILQHGTNSPCFTVYSATDLFIYGFLAFSCACLFVPVVRSKSGPKEPQTKPVQTTPKSPKTKLLTSSVVALVCFFGAFAPTSVHGQDNGPEMVRVGFRADVEPFSYFDAEENRYRGYLVDLCYAIFEAAREGSNGKSDNSGDDYVVVPVEVTAGDRFNAFKDDPETPQIDLLCDPVTLRFPQEDDDGRDGGIFSPVVFTSGVSYLHRRPGGGDGSVLLGYVDKSTAHETATHACEADLFKVSRGRGDDGCNHVPFTNKCQAAPSNNRRIEKDRDGEELEVTWFENKYYYCVFGSHEEAIEWFCSDTKLDDQSKSYAVERAYFGDRDIIVGKLESHLNDNLPCRGAESKNETYTYEPYALVINKEDPDFVRFVQRRVYQIFSNRDEIASIFSANFGGKQMTPTLASLFLLNAVEPAD